MYINYQESKTIVKSALKNALFRAIAAVTYCSYYNHAASQNS